MLEPEKIKSAIGDAMLKFSGIDTDNINPKELEIKKIFLYM